jgi:hypothetical protein
MNETKIVFKAHRAFVTLFYTLLAIWTLISVPLMAIKFSELGNVWIGMISFVIMITWFWSLGLVHCIIMENGGIIRMISIRRNITVKMDDFRRIDGPPSRIGFGFIRFRLERNTLYAFFCYSEPLKKILTTIRNQSPDTRFIRFSTGYFKGVLR